MPHRHRFRAPFLCTGTAFELLHLTLGHADDAGVGPNHQHGKVGRVAREAKNGRLEVLFVPREVDKRQDLGEEGDRENTRRG